MQRVTEVGNYFRKQLRRLQRRQPGLIKEVRGLGLMIGAELTFNGKSTVVKMLERGFLMNCTHDTVLRFLPPLIVDKKLVDLACETLDTILTESEKPQAPQVIA